MVFGWGSANYHRGGRKAEPPKPPIQIVAFHPKQHHRPSERSPVLIHTTYTQPSPSIVIAEELTSVRGKECIYIDGLLIVSRYSVFPRSFVCSWLFPSAAVTGLPSKARSVTDKLATSESVSLECYPQKCCRHSISSDNGFNITIASSDILPAIGLIAQLHTPSPRPRAWPESSEKHEHATSYLSTITDFTWTE